MSKNTTKNLVSIIMNCRNDAKFIDRSMSSALKQHYKNFEIIFYDNFSNDNTRKIIKQYKDKRINYYKSNKYLKLYDARNKAIKKSKGEYITFLDIDDEWHHEKLKYQINQFHKYDLDVSYTNYWISKNNKKKLFKKKIECSDIKDQILNDYPIGILTSMVKSDIFFKENYLFNKNYEIIGDFDFFFRLSKRFKFNCINLPLATSHNHGNNLSIKKLNVEISEFKKWYSYNKLYLSKFKNNIKQVNLMRQCNLLYSKKNLKFFSKELINLSSFPIKIKFYIKLILQLFRLDKMKMII